MKTSIASGYFRLMACAALHVDVEDGDALAGDRLVDHRLRAAVEVAVDLGPLDELAPLDLLLEGHGVDEAVVDAVLLLPARAAGGVADREDARRASRPAGGGRAWSFRARGSGEHEQQRRAGGGGCGRAHSTFWTCSRMRSSSAFMRDDARGDLRVLALGAGGVHLAVHLLDEEVHLAARRARSEAISARNWARCEREPGHLLGDVGALGEEGDLLGQPLRVDGDAPGQLGDALVRRARYSSTALGASAATCFADAMVSTRPSRARGRRDGLALDLRASAISRSRRLLERLRRAPAARRRGPRRAPRGGSRPGCGDTSRTRTSSGAPMRSAQLAEGAPVLAGQGEVDLGHAAGGAGGAWRLTSTSTAPRASAVLDRAWSTAGSRRRELSREARLHLAELVIERLELDGELFALDRRPADPKPVMLLSMRGARGFCTRGQARPADLQAA